MTNSKHGFALAEIRWDGKRAAKAGSRPAGQRLNLLETEYAQERQLLGALPFHLIQ